MTDSDLLRTLELLDTELAQIERTIVGGDPPDTSVSHALLLHQADLLSKKAHVFLQIKSPKEAAATAGQVVSLVDALRRRNRADPQLVDLWFRSHLSLGLANVQLNDLVHARAILAMMEELGQSNAEGWSDKWAPYLWELTAALESEGQARLISYQTARTEERKKDEALRGHWSDVERALNELIAEIAVKIVEAGNLLQRTPNPERFQIWLMERLSQEMQQVPRRIERSPLDEDDGLILEARERGENLQRAVFDSKEMLTAKSIRLGSKQASDESLQPLRENGQLIGLPHPDDEQRFAYPKWQLDPQHRLTVLDILRELHGVPAWAQWNFFHSGRPELCELSVLQVLRLEPSEDERELEDQLRKLEKSHGHLSKAVVAAAQQYVQGQD